MRSEFRYTAKSKAYTNPSLAILMLGELDYEKEEM